MTGRINLDVHIVGLLEAAGLVIMAKNSMG